MLQITMPCDRLLVTDTASYLLRLATIYGLPQSEKSVFLFLLESIIELRTLKPNEKDPVLTIAVELKQGRFVVSVTDKGLPYVLTENEKHALRAGHVDRFRFDQLGAGGQRITLEFRLGERSKAPQILEPPKEELLDKNFSCRFTKVDDQDIVEVIRCIYYSYGYEYVHQEIYHTDEFKRMLRGGKYQSLLAENEHGQVVGHIALAEHDWFAGMPEVCNLVVSPVARGNNIASMLVNYALEVCEERGFNALYGIPVMFHPASQKMLHQHGFVPSGMYFHLCQSGASTQYGDGKHRLDAAFAVRIRDRQTTHTLYLPDECAAFVTHVFDKVEVPYTVTDSRQTAPVADKSAMNYTVDTVVRKLEVMIARPGKDFLESMETPPFEREVGNVEVIMVYLNMNDPGCGLCYRYLREHGYIFTGCLPGSADGDYLLLQHLMGQEIIKEGLVTMPDYESMLESLYAIDGIA